MIDLIKVHTRQFSKRQMTWFKKIQNVNWKNLSAYKNKKLYLVDGNQYFNRPGPRIVDSLEILAEIFNPDIFNYGYKGRGWVNYFD